MRNISFDIPAIGAGAISQLTIKRGNARSKTKFSTVEAANAAELNAAVLFEILIHVKSDW